ncbi:MAG TPA: hypothetical protein PK829_02260 [Promineifilum sp.]|nr:hypothetical protein [Promineifilum sp.]HQF69797.1 hypothetical protein [Promineifilum sp.]
MAVSTKGKRKVNVRGRQYIWYVSESGRTTAPEQGFVVEGDPARILHIIASNKQFIVHYRLPQTGDTAAQLTVEGPDIPRAPGARQVEVPRWRHDSNPYPTADFVRRLIGWCLGLEQT